MSCSSERLASVVVEHEAVARWRLGALVGRPVKLSEDPVIGPRWAVVLRGKEAHRLDDGVQAIVQLLELVLNSLKALLSPDCLYRFGGSGDVHEIFRGRIAGGLRRITRTFVQSTGDCTARRTGDAAQN